MLAVSEISAAPVVALMAFGVLVAIAGHVLRARYVVATGLVILFVATAAMLLGGYAAYEDDPTDPRRQNDPREPTF